MAKGIKRNLKAEKGLKTRSYGLLWVAENDPTRFRSRTQHSEKSKLRGSRARQKAALRHDAD